MLLFQSDSYVVWILLCAIAVWGIVGWLEFKRKQKYLPLRLLAVTLAVISLLGLILKPAVLQHKTSDYIILTKNYNTHVLDSLTQRYPSSQLYRMPEVASVTGTAVVKNYRDLNELKGNIHLLGDGVPAYMLDYLDTAALRYYPSASPQGFTTLAGQKTYKQNQVNTVEGIFQSHGKSFTLKLNGGAITEDSIKITGTAAHLFALKFTPKTSGNFIYTLSATDSTGKTNYTERVPVEVIEQKPLTILVLSDYPTAEIKFLKNYLEAEKHQLTLRYTISKNKYRTEFINTAKRNSVQLNSSALAAYDLVIIDGTALTSLPENQLRELKNATLTGLGALVLVDAPIPVMTTNFLEVKTVSVKNDTASLQLQSGLLKNTAVPVSLIPSRKITTTLTERSGRTVAGYQQNGLGKLGFQLLTNTYRLQLAGKKDTYAEIWSTVLTETARQELQQHSFTKVTPFPVYEDEPIAFEIISATEKPMVHLDRIQLALLENSLVSNIWQANAWAGTPGWHTLNINKNTHTLFVSDTSEWKAMRIRQQQASLQKIAGDQLQSIPQTVHQPIAPIFFYLLFLLAAGFLWLAPKLS